MWVQKWVNDCTSQKIKDIKYTPLRKQNAFPPTQVVADFSKQHVLNWPVYSTSSPRWDRTCRGQVVATRSVGRPLDRRRSCQHGRQTPRCRPCPPHYPPLLTPSCQTSTTLPHQLWTHTQNHIHNKLSTQLYYNIFAGKLFFYTAFVQLHRWVCAHVRHFHLLSKAVIMWVRVRVLLTCCSCAHSIYIHSRNMQTPCRKRVDPPLCHVH